MVRVTTLTSEVVRAIMGPVEFDAKLDEIANRDRSLSNHALHHRPVIQTTPSGHRVLDVLGQSRTIQGIEDGRDSALGPIGRRIFCGLLGDDEDVMPSAREPNGRGQAGDPAPDDQGAHRSPTCTSDFKGTIHGTDTAMWDMVHGCSWACDACSCRSPVVWRCSAS